MSGGFVLTFLTGSNEITPEVLYQTSDGITYNAERDDGATLLMGSVFEDSISLSAFYPVGAVETFILLDFDYEQSTASLMFSKARHMEVMASSIVLVGQCSMRSL